MFIFLDIPWIKNQLPSYHTRWSFTRIIEDNVNTIHMLYTWWSYIRIEKKMKKQIVWTWSTCLCSCTPDEVTLELKKKITWTRSTLNGPYFYRLSWILVGITNFCSNFEFSVSLQAKFYLVCSKYNSPPKNSGWWDNRTHPPPGK